MRKMLVAAAAAVLIPSAALAQEKDKPGVADSLGAAAGGALGYTAGAAGGPLGSAVGGLVGQSIGKGLVGGLKKLFGVGKDKPSDAAEAAAKGPGPATLAELSPPAAPENAPATLEDLKAAEGAAPAAEEASAPAADTAPDASALDIAPPQAVPAPAP